MAASSAVLTVQTRFGTFPADPAAIVTMADGLPGFERCRQFVLVSSDTLSPLTCVQGIDASQPSFLAVDPRLVEPAYREQLTAADRVRLGAVDDEPLLWLALVRVSPESASVNLRAPIVINPRRMIGRQVMPAESDYAVDHPLILD